MLPARNRLKNRTAIRQILDEGKWTKDRHFTVKYRPAEGRESKAAAVISKKLDKRATVRNRLKRRIMEALKEPMARLPCPYEIILIPRSSALELTPEEIRDSLRYLCKKMS